MLGWARTLSGLNQSPTPALQNGNCSKYPGSMLITCGLVWSGHPRSNADLSDFLSLLSFPALALSYAFICTRYSGLWEQAVSLYEAAAVLVSCCVSVLTGLVQHSLLGIRRENEKLNTKVSQYTVGVLGVKATRLRSRVACQRLPSRGKFSGALDASSLPHAPVTFDYPLSTGQHRPPGAPTMVYYYAYFFLLYR